MVGAGVAPVTPLLLRLDEEESFFLGGMPGEVSGELGCELGWELGRSQET